jgi:RNA polymerase sigma-70 factor (ECF subfamily)
MAIMRKKPKRETVPERPAISRGTPAEDHSADLAFARACAAGDAAALRTFETTFAPEFERAAARAGSQGLDPDDLRQRALATLFTAQDDQRPKIHDYAGRGSLRAWLRVVLARIVVDHVRVRSGRERTLRDDAAVGALREQVDDPEVRYLKRLYRHELAQAFEEAFHDLAPELKNALRHRYADRLSIDQIAAAHGIHRATAARRVAEAEQALCADTRQRMASRLRLSKNDLASVIRLIESQLHASVTRLFAAG